MTRHYDLFYYTYFPDLFKTTYRPWIVNKCKGNDRNIEGLRYTRERSLSHGSTLGPMGPVDHDDRPRSQGRGHDRHDDRPRSRSAGFYEFCRFPVTPSPQPNYRRSSYLYESNIEFIIKYPLSFNLILISRDIRGVRLRCLCEVVLLTTLTSGHLPRDCGSSTYNPEEVSNDLT